LQALQAPLPLQAIHYELPRARDLWIHLASPCHGSTAGPVEQLLGAPGYGAYTGEPMEPAGPASPAVLGIALVEAVGVPAGQMSSRSAGLLALAAFVRPGLRSPLGSGLARADRIRRRRLGRVRRILSKLGLQKGYPLGLHGDPLGLLSQPRRQHLYIDLQPSHHRYLSAQLGVLYAQSLNKDQRVG